MLTSLLLYTFVFLFLLVNTTTITIDCENTATDISNTNCNNADGAIWQSSSNPKEALNSWIELCFNGNGVALNDLSYTFKILGTCNLRDYLVPHFDVTWLGSRWLGKGTPILDGFNLLFDDQSPSLNPTCLDRVVFTTSSNTTSVTIQGLNIQWPSTTNAFAPVSLTGGRPVAATHPKQIRVLNNKITFTSFADAQPDVKGCPGNLEEGAWLYYDSGLSRSRSDLEVYFEENVIDLRSFSVVDQPLFLFADATTSPIPADSVFKFFFNLNDITPHNVGGPGIGDYIIKGCSGNVSNDAECIVSMDSNRIHLLFDNNGGLVSLCDNDGNSSTKCTLSMFHTQAVSLKFNGVASSFVSVCNGLNKATCTFTSGNSVTLGTNVDNGLDLTGSNSFYSFCNGIGSSATCHVEVGSLRTLGISLGSQTSIDNNKNNYFIVGCQETSKTVCNVTLTDFNINGALRLNYYSSFVSLCGSGFSNHDNAAMGTECNLTVNRMTLGGNVRLGGRMFSVCNPVGDLAHNVLAPQKYDGTAKCTAVITESNFLSLINVSTVDAQSGFEFGTYFVMFGTAQKGARVVESTLTVDGNQFGTIDTTLRAANLQAIAPFAAIFAGDANHISSSSFVSVFVRFNTFNHLNLWLPNHQLVSVGLSLSNSVATDNDGQVNANFEFLENVLTTDVTQFYNGPIVQYSKRLGNNAVASTRNNVAFSNNVFSGFQQYYTPANSNLPASYGPAFLFVTLPQADNVDISVVNNTISRMRTVVQNSGIPSLFGFFTSPKAQNLLSSSVSFSFNTINDVYVDNLDAITYAYTTFAVRRDTVNIWNVLQNIGLDFLSYSNNPTVFGAAVAAHGFNEVFFDDNTFDNIRNYTMLLNFRSINSLSFGGANTIQNNVASSSSLSTTMHIANIGLGYFSPLTYVTDNVASLGGAFYSEYAHISLDSALFNNNQATGLSTTSSGNSGIVSGDGGHIFMNGGDLFFPSILDGIAGFSNGAAAGNGGAIFVGFNPDLLLTSSDSLTTQFSEVGPNVVDFSGDFTSNIAAINGGAIYAVTNLFNLLQTSHSTFTFNIAGQSGGAIYFENSTGLQNLVLTTLPAFINNADFTQNQAVGNDLTPSFVKAGGDIGSTRSLVINECNFDGSILSNCASGQPYPFDGTGASIYVGSSLVMTNTTVSNTKYGSTCPHVAVFAVQGQFENAAFTSSEVRVGVISQTEVNSTFITCHFTRSRLEVDHNAEFVNCRFTSSPVDVSADLNQTDSTFTNSSTSVNHNLYDIGSIRSLNSSVSVNNDAFIKFSISTGSGLNVFSRATIESSSYLTSPVFVSLDALIIGSSFTDSGVTVQRNLTIRPSVPGLGAIASAFFRSNLSVSEDANVTRLSFVASTFRVSGSAWVSQSSHDSTSDIFVLGDVAQFSQGTAQSPVVLINGNFTTNSFVFTGSSIVSGTNPGSVGLLIGSTFQNGTFVDHSASLFMFDDTFENNPFAAFGVVTSNSTHYKGSSVLIKGPSTFIFGDHSDSTFNLESDAKIGFMTFNGSTGNIATTTARLGGSSSLNQNNFFGSNITVYGPASLLKNVLTDSTVQVQGGGTFSAQSLTRSTLVIGPIAGGPFTLSQLVASSVVFSANGQVVGNKFDSLSNVTIVQGAIVELTDGMIPNLYCDSVSGITVPSTVHSSIFGSEVNCTYTGFSTMRVNPGSTVTFGHITIGNPNDDNGTIFIAQGARVIFNGLTNSYANIYNLGLVEMMSDSSLTMIDAVIENHGKWRFHEFFTYIASGSNLYINESQFTSWFHNDGGEVESLGFPQLAIKFNNTGGLMTATVDSTNSEAEIIGGFTFSGAEVIFSNSRFRAIDVVTIFNYNPWYPFNQEVDNNFVPGSFGLPFTPIITLPRPFSPTRNGFFDADQRDHTDYAQYVRYHYNDYLNEIPDGVESDTGLYPRLLMVNYEQQLDPQNYTNELTLIAATNTLFVSPLLFLIFSSLSLFLFMF